MPDDTSIEMLSARRPHAFLESWYALSDESHFWFRWRLAALMRQLRDLHVPIHDKLRALDVGGGTGVLRLQIEAATAWDVDVTDLDYAALRRAKPGRGRILYYDILDEKADLRERYDVILLFDVLEHIEHTQPFIKALLSHLKVGGHLLVNVPALPALSSRYDQAQGHYRRYRKETLQGEFRDCAVTVRDTRYWGLSNVAPLFMRRLWLARSREQRPEAILRQGFRAPHRLVNRAFLALMRLEMAATARPPLGSSVLLVGEKNG